MLGLIALTSCGPIDHPLGADLDGRHYYASCKTDIPIDQLGEPIDGVVRWMPEWEESDERVIAGVAIEEGFASHVPDNVCGKPAKWVVLFNNDLPSDTVNALEAQFSRGKDPG
jgi:hypothetical protein